MEVLGKDMQATLTSCEGSSNSGTKGLFCSSSDECQKLGREILPVSLLLESSRLLRLVMPTQDEGTVPA